MAVSSTITFPVFKILDFAAMYIFFRIHWTFVLKIAFLVEYWHIKCVKRHETVSKQQTILWRTIIKKYDLGWYILCNLECLHRQTRARVVLYTCRDPSCYTGDCWSSTYLKCDKFVLCQDTGGGTPGDPPDGSQFLVTTCENFINNNIACDLTLSLNSFSNGCKYEKLEFQGPLGPLL